MNCDEIEWYTRMDSVGDEEISEVEDLLGIKFPDDYKECVKKYHGGCPKPEAFDFKKRKEAVFSRLLTFDPDDTDYYIPNNLDWIKDRLVNNIYPFAEDPFGNFICFDYREESTQSPKVVFWDHEVAFQSPEEAISYICDSFTELIYKLYRSE